VTTREKNLVKEAVARTRFELRDRVAAPGTQDAHWVGPDRITRADAHEIRDYVRERLSKAVA